MQVDELTRVATHDTHFNSLYKRSNVCCTVPPAAFERRVLFANLLVKFEAEV
jgi:hypothetical protein